MKLSDYIQNKISQLEDQGMKQVKFLSATNCTLVENGIYETFLIEESNLEEECFEIELSNIEYDAKVRGSQLRIFGIPKRKRKGKTLYYHIGLND